MGKASTFQLSSIRLAIAGDLHGLWGPEDHALLTKLQPDGVLFVGDLSEGDLRFAKSIKSLPFPTAVILGNHDRGQDKTGSTLQTQLKILGDLHCGWKHLHWPIHKISLVGARPCSPGGGFHLSRTAQAVFGPLTLNDSSERIVCAARSVPDENCLIILAHSGPSGLGAESNSICGRDWKKPSMDWGDQDLELAIDQIRKDHLPALVVFGHMHHNLKSGHGLRETFHKDKWGTIYLNAASVPRRFIDKSGRTLTHFTWVELIENCVQLASHRWFDSDGLIVYQETLLNRSNFID